MNSSSVPCKFFAEGRCRFGTSCRFSHQQQSFGSSSSGFYGDGSGGFGSAKFSQAGGDMKNYDAVIEAMQKDLREWESGKIWPLTSYGPLGNHKCIAGFTDVSAEEVRYEQLENRSQLPSNHLSEKLSQVAKLRSIIIHDRSVARNLIDQIYREQSGNLSSSSPSSQASAAPNLYSLLKPTASPAGSIFGGSQAPSTGGIFGQAPANVNPFQQQPQQNQLGLGQSPQSSIFGPSSPNSSFLSNTSTQMGSTQQMSSIFGNPAIAPGNATSPLNQSATIFAQPNFNTFGSSAFSPGNETTQSVSSIFGGSSGIGAFATTPQQQQQQQQPLTIPATAQSLFGSALSPIAPQQQLQQQNSIFGGPMANPVLGGQTSTPFVGGGGATFTTDPQSFGGQSTFGGSAFQMPQPQQQIAPAIVPLSSMSSAPNMLQQPSGGFFNAPTESPRDKINYSQMSDLTQEEIEAFKADSFGSLDAIPLKPPPKELCFR